MTLQVLDQFRWLVLNNSITIDQFFVGIVYQGHFWLQIKENGTGSHEGFKVNLVIGRDEFANLCGKFAFAARPFQERSKMLLALVKALRFAPRAF